MRPGRLNDGYPPAHDARVRCPCPTPIAPTSATAAISSAHSNPDAGTYPYANACTAYPHAHTGPTYSYTDARTAHPHPAATYADSHATPYTAPPHADTNAYAHAHLNADGQCSRDPDRHRDADTDAHAYRNADVHAHANVNPDGQPNGYGHGNTYSNAHGYVYPCAADLYPDRDAHLHPDTSDANAYMDAHPYSGTPQHRGPGSRHRASHCGTGRTDRSDLPALALYSRIMVKGILAPLQCPVCGTRLPQPNASTVPTVRRCPSCGVGYTYPPPTSVPSPTWQNLNFPRPARWRTVVKRVITGPNIPHVRLLLGIRPPPYPAARALDIGCGPGLYVRALQRLGWHAFGLDLHLPSPPPTRTVLQADAHTLPLASESVYLVTCWHVLEHLTHPLACLQEAHRVLRERGELFVEVPHLDSLQAKVLGRGWLHWDLDRHVWHFTRPTLRQLLHRAGFHRINIISMPNSPGWVHSLHLSSRWNPVGWMVDSLAALMRRGGVLRAWARKEP